MRITHWVCSCRCLRHRAVVFFVLGLPCLRWTRNAVLAAVLVGSKRTWEKWVIFHSARLLFGRLSIVCSRSKEVRCVRGCVLSRFPRPVHELTGIFTFPSSPFWF